MPEIARLPLHRYAPDRPDLPPEWTAAPSGPFVHEPELALLAAKSPRNVVHAERLGAAGTSGATVARWLDEGVLAAMAPAFHLLRGETPDGRARWGLLGGVPLVDAAGGGLLRLERVYPSERDEKLARMRAARTQFAPVLGLLEPDSGLAELAARVAVGEPFMEYRQGDGARHAIWRVAEAEEDAARAVASGRKALVAGGHVALAASLALWAELGPGTPGNRRPWDYVLCCLADGGPDEPVAAPVHRVLTWFRKFDWERVLTAAEEHFQVRPANMPEDLAASGPGAFLLYLPTTLWLLIPRTTPGEPSARLTAGAAAGSDPELGKDAAMPTAPAATAGAGHGAGQGAGRDAEHGVGTSAGQDEAGGLLARSSAHVFDQGFLRGVLGLGDEELARHYLDYALSPEEALRLVRGGKVQAAFVVRPSPLADLRRLAAAGLELPPRSVAFPPCLPSGLVMYRNG